jgi:glutamine amidotransferase-like uncharacterized protein
MATIALLAPGVMSRAETSTSTPASTAVPAPHVLHIAIYDDGGGSQRGVENVNKCLGTGGLPPASTQAAESASTFTTKTVKAEDVRAGALKGIDVLVQPGGSGSKQAAALGSDGREAIRQFVKSGGGYVGICAGAYLATTDYDWSLGILNAKVVDRKHWARGSGFVHLRVTETGKKVLGLTDDVVNSDYNQGPLLAPDTKEEPAAYEALALFDSEIAEKGAPKGVMQGTTAIARGTFGKGRVICLSPHLERSPGLDVAIRHAVIWTAGEGER